MDSRRRARAAGSLALSDNPLPNPFRKLAVVLPEIHALDVLVEQAQHWVLPQQVLARVGGVHAAPLGSPLGPIDLSPGDPIIDVRSTGAEEPAGHRVVAHLLRIRVLGVELEAGED